MPKPRHNDRQCIQTRDALPDRAFAIRFVRGPGDHPVADLAEKLPGRGAWITAERDILARALTQGAFSRAFKAPTDLPEAQTIEEFCDALEAQLQARGLSWLGLARRSGQLVSGADTVKRRSAELIGYVTPCDAAPDGVRKVRGSLEDQRRIRHISLTTDAEGLGQALGNMGIVHVGLIPGKVSKAALWELSRWQAFRAQTEIKTP